MNNYHKKQLLTAACSDTLKTKRLLKQRCTSNGTDRHHHHHHHHQITKLSHSINAIGPAPHRSGRKREHH
jgi:hypothetical protein